MKDMKDKDIKTILNRILYGEDKIVSLFFAKGWPLDLDSRMWRCLPMECYRDLLYEIMSRDDLVIIKTSSNYGVVERVDIRRIN